MAFSPAKDRQQPSSTQSYWRRQSEWALLAVETGLTSLAGHPKKPSFSKSSNGLLLANNVMSPFHKITTTKSHQLEKAQKRRNTVSSSTPILSESLPIPSALAPKNTPHLNTSELKAPSPVPQTKPTRFSKIEKILQANSVDIELLQKASWGGIPNELRPEAWQILMGYLPVNANRRTAAIERKHKEYFATIEKTFASKQDSLDTAIWHQISIDIPRTYSDIPLFKSERLRESLARVLYCWAIRHPASGYVQGMNDLASIFYAVFISKYTGYEIPLITTDQVDQIAESDFKGVEADCFWCLTNLIGKIHDSYTFTQPGIQRQIVKLKELVLHINPVLYKHLETEGVQFLLFSFRWFNCLLVREFSITSILRIWDTYLSDEDDDGFATFHLYTCAALLLKWADELLQKDFSEIVLFLQTPPSLTWTTSDLEILLSEAYTYKSLYNYSALLH